MVIAHCYVQQAISYQQLISLSTTSQALPRPPVSEVDRASRHEGPVVSLVVNGEESIYGSKWYKVVPFQL